MQRPVNLPASKNKPLQQQNPPAGRPQPQNIPVHVPPLLLCVPAKPGKQRHFRQQLQRLPKAILPAFRGQCRVFQQAAHIRPVPQRRRKGCQSQRPAKQNQRRRARHGPWANHCPVKDNQHRQHRKHPIRRRTAHCIAVKSPAFVNRLAQSQAQPCRQQVTFQPISRFGRWAGRRPQQQPKHPQPCRLEPQLLPQGCRSYSGQKHLRQRGRQQRRPKGIGRPTCFSDGDRPLSSQPAR